MYQEKALLETERRNLSEFVSSLKWEPVLNAKRKVAQFGYTYPYDRRATLTKTYPIPDSILAIVSRLGTTVELLKDWVPDQLIINRYEPGEGISKHIDHTRFFGDRIVCFSLGAQTDMVFRRDAQKFMQPVTDGSVYIMSGESRYKWTHEMPKRKRMKGVRYSFTFRQVQH